MREQRRAHSSIRSIITVLDMDTNSTQRVNYRMLRWLFDTTNNRYMVIDMSFKLVPQQQLQKRGILSTRSPPPSGSRQGPCCECVFSEAPETTQLACGGRRSG